MSRANKRVWQIDRGFDIIKKWKEVDKNDEKEKKNNN